MKNLFQKYIEDLDDDDRDDFDELEILYSILDTIGDETEVLRQKLKQRVIKRFEQLCKMHNINIDDAYSTLSMELEQTDAGDIGIISVILNDGL